MSQVWIRANSSTLVQEVYTGDKLEHFFYVDEPKGKGKEDRGPSPYDLLLGSLGSCTSMTLILYARRKEWPLESLEIELSQSRSHEEDCKACESDQRYSMRIDRRIKMEGPISMDQKRRLMDIAKRCPVAKLLSSDIQIVDELLEDSAAA